MITHIEDILNYDLSDKDTIVSILNPLDIYIYYSYEIVEGVSIPSYAVLNIDRYHSDYSQLAMMSHGTLLDIKNNKIVYIGCPPINPNYKSIEVKNRIISGRYNIYKAMDGTSISLYWYNNKWRMASAKNANIGQVSIGKCITYEEAFTECLAKYDLNLNLMDKNVVYSVVFKHPALHPYSINDNNYQIQFIRSQSIGKFRETEKIADIVVSYKAPSIQKFHSLITNPTNIDEPEVVPSGMVIGKNESGENCLYTTSIMFPEQTLLNISYEDIMESIENALSEHIHLHDSSGYESNFGYILRQEDISGHNIDPISHIGSVYESDIGEFNQVYIESTLKTFIKNTVDNNAMNKIIRYNNFEKFKYISLNACCFNVNYYKNFVIVFPNLMLYIEKCRNYFKFLIESINEYILAINNRNVKHKNYSSTLSETQKMLVADISTYIKFAKEHDHKDIKSVVSAFVFNKDNLITYYNDIFTE